jgi:hypothetical protein
MKKTALFVLCFALGMTLATTTPVVAVETDTETEQTDTRLATPEITAPDENATTTVGVDIVVKWDKVDNADKYEFEYFVDNSYATSTKDIEDIEETQYTIKNPAEGVYYLRVRAVDDSGNYSKWSNSKGNPYRVIVGSALLPIGEVIAEKTACMVNDGWKGFNFKNQGLCVAYYNQQIRGHIENILRIMQQKYVELVTEVQKQVKERNAKALQNSQNQKKQAITCTTDANCDQGWTCDKGKCKADAETDDTESNTDKTNNAGGNGNGNKN